MPLDDEADFAEFVSCLGDELHSDGDLGVTQGDERHSTSLQTGARPTDSVALASGRILVVDGDISVRRRLASILADGGFDVRDVGSAGEARHVLAHDTIALLLSEVCMAGETGLDLLRFAAWKHPETATLLISAREDAGITQAAIDVGACAYLSKPVSRSAVLVAVVNALRRRDTQAREQAARENLERSVALHAHALSDARQRVEGAARHSRVLQAEMIHRWAQAAEYRDPGIRGHLKRMSHYCGVLGHKLGLHSKSFELASVLHDVGKLTIPDRILLKPGPLTGDERLAIETHAELGYEMLRGSSSSLLELAALIARTHHEKFDGTGYPRGLSGTDIPLEGRIAAVADIFDALTCDRVYRRAWSLEATVAWIKRQRGRHFDPVVVDALLSSVDEILAIDAAQTSA